MVAEVTAHARIALCVTNLASRHPAVSTAAIALLDLLAQGRAILGLGAGYSGTRNQGIAVSMSLPQRMRSRAIPADS
jgi:alkanesulfonate monooxygenase SsuD/methylene tetrahydromethanopterin reductase-like flavin-dependent oxidoreductase (luciferase family)